MTPSNQHFIDRYTAAAAIGEARGIEAVVEAINTHIDNAGVCEWGCGALWSMTEFNGKNTDKYKNN